MPTGNPNYTLDALGYDAVAVENQISREWEPIWFKSCPVAAMIHEGQAGFRKKGIGTISGNSITTPVMLSGVTSFNELTAGVDDADEIPTAWPTYDPVEGFTNAQYQFTHITRPLVQTSSQRMLLEGSNTRASLHEGRVAQLQGTFADIIANMLSGSNPDSRKSLMGLLYAASTSNVVGGISQASNADWQALVSTPAGGVLTLTELSTAADKINRNASLDGKPGKADLVLLSFNGTGFNCYNKVRESILPALRINDQAFSVKYGITNFVYNDMRCVMDNRLGASSGSGTTLVMRSSDWFYVGSKQMKMLQRQRILGSAANEDMFEWWGVFGCSQVRNMARLNGITS